MKKARLLYVEDDETLGFVTRDNLEMKGFDITHCTNGKQALDQFYERDFDLCILDVMLPEVDGFQVAETIRTVNRDLPIIFLTARSLKDDRLYGLKLGGDDYLTKPFSIEELVLKIEIFLKRRKVVEFDEKPLKGIAIGKYIFEHSNLELRLGQKQASYLTQREADLLLLLAKNLNIILKRSDILVKIWGEDDYFLGRSLDVFISRLRKYLKDDENIKLENVHGVGFRLKA